MLVLANVNCMKMMDCPNKSSFNQEDFCLSRKKRYLVEFVGDQSRSICANWEMCPALILRYKLGSGFYQINHPPPIRSNSL